MNILFEDDALVVCEKPAGVSSQHKDGERDLPALLRAATGAREIFPVHRLDTAVGGVMVFAETGAAAAALSAQLREGAFRKTYFCVVRGEPETRADTLEDLLFHDRGKNKSYVVKRERKGVKRAKLSYETLAVRETEKGVLSLLRVRLFTGRTHQIRVQLASRGHPLAGDGKYGAADKFPAPALFCAELSFRHPATGETLTFSLQPPETAPWSLFERERYYENDILPRCDNMISG